MPVSGAHVEGQTGTATGTAAHVEGSGSTASGDYSHAEGITCTASGTASRAGGNTSTASGNTSTAQGYATTAGGKYSTAGGIQSTAPRHGQRSYSGGMFGTVGDAQEGRLTFYKETADATATPIYADGWDTTTLTGEATNVLTIVVNRAFRIRLDVIGRNYTAAEAVGFTIHATIVRGASGAAVIIGTPNVVSEKHANLSTCDVTLAIDSTNTTNNFLKISVTGKAATSIRWVARLVWVESGV